jgi:hypothetical protein
MKELTRENVEEIFEKCLFKEDEVVDGKPIINPLIGHGIIQDVDFHPDRLHSYETKIKEMLSQLPESFMKSKGGGMSFLNACETKDGHQWGEHRNMEQLFVLGNACGIVTYPMPKNMWNILPGGMPYITVIDN